MQAPIWTRRSYPAAVSSAKTDGTAPLLRWRGDPERSSRACSSLLRDGPHAFRARVRPRTNRGVRPRETSAERSAAHATRREIESLFLHGPAVGQPELEPIRGRRKRRCGSCSGLLRSLGGRGRVIRTTATSPSSTLCCRRGWVHPHFEASPHASLQGVVRKRIPLRDFAGCSARFLRRVRLVRSCGESIRPTRGMSVPRGEFLDGYLKTVEQHLFHPARDGQLLKCFD